MLMAVTLNFTVRYTTWFYRTLWALLISYKEIIFSIHTTQNEEIEMNQILCSFWKFLMTFYC